MTKKLSSAYRNSFQEMLWLIPHGPFGWQRYRVTQGKSFVERGDPLGPRGVPAIERHG
jgi:hypothetical protein